MKPTICLAMIVKNEAPVIERCLTSVLPLIDCWAISDTGSSDNTQQIIQEFFQKHNIPGELFQDEWQDFAHNRTLIVQRAKNMADYTITLDADEVFKLDDDFQIPDLTSDMYNVPTVLDGLTYDRIQLFKNTLDWKYIGILHEHLYCEDAKTEGRLTGITNYPSQDGNRSQDPEKYKKDAETLEKALQKDPDNSRYRFYLAQSYYCDKQYDRALINYKIRTQMDQKFEEEVFISHYRIGLCHIKRGSPLEQVIGSLLLAYQERPTRLEPIYQIVSQCRLKEKYYLGYQIGKDHLDKEKPDDTLFVEEQVYDYLFKYEMIALCYLMEKHQEAINLINTLSGVEMPVTHLQSLIQIKKLCQDKLKELNLDAIFQKISRPIDPDFERELEKFVKDKKVNTVLEIGESITFSEATQKEFVYPDRDLCVIRDVLPYLHVRNVYLILKKAMKHCKYVLLYHDYLQEEGILENKDGEYQPLDASKYPLKVANPQIIFQNEKKQMSFIDSSKEKMTVEEYLQQVLKEMEINTVCEIECGYLEKDNPIKNYAGYSSSQTVVNWNRTQFENTSFELLNDKTEIKNADLYLLKDVFQNWSNEQIMNFFEKANCKYIITVNNCEIDSKPELVRYFDIMPGKTRKLDARNYPLKFFRPVILNTLKGKQVVLFYKELIDRIPIPNNQLTLQKRTEFSEILMLGNVKLFSERMDKTHYKFYKYLQEHFDIKIVQPENQQKQGCYGSSSQNIEEIIQTNCQTRNPIVYVWDLSAISLIKGLETYRRSPKVYDFEDIGFRLGMHIDVINKFHFDYVLGKYDTLSMDMMRRECSSAQFLRYDFYLQKEWFTHVPKKYDVVCYGFVDEWIYEDRYHWFNLLKEQKKISVFIVPHPGYEKAEHEYVGEKLFELISSAKIAIVSPSILEYGLQKYHEIALSKAALCGRLPRRGLDKYRDCFIDLEDLSDKQILEKIQYYLDHPEELDQIVEKAYQVCSENYLYENGLELFRNFFGHLTVHNVEKPPLEQKVYYPLAKTEIFYQNEITFVSLSEEGGILKKAVLLPGKQYKITVSVNDFNLSIRLMNQDRVIDEIPCHHEVIYLAKEEVHSLVLVSYNQYQLYHLTEFSVERIQENVKPYRFEPSSKTTYIIQLTRDPVRVEHVKEHLVNNLTDVQVVDCFDYLKHDLKEFFQRNDMKPVKHTFKMGQLAVACSHYSVWLNQLENQIPAVTVLEDDSNIPDNFTFRLNQITKELPEDFDILYLYFDQSRMIWQDYPKFRHLKKEDYCLPEKKLIEKGFPSYGFVGYYLSLKGAKKLIEMYKTIDTTIDDMMARFVFENKVNAYCVKDILVTTAGALIRDEDKDSKRYSSNIWKSDYFRQ